MFSGARHALHDSSRVQGNSHTARMSCHASSGRHLTDMRRHVQAHGQTGGEAQEWVRAMLGTVGRGGNAQVCPLYIRFNQSQTAACMHI